MCRKLCSVIIFSLLVFSLAGGTAKLEISGRKAFIRNEKNAFLKVVVKSAKGNLSNLSLTWNAPCQAKKAYSVKAVASGKSILVKIPVETRLTAGTYPITLTLKGKGLSKAATLKTQLYIGEELHDQMMVLSWGYYPWHHKDLQEVGFTHAMEGFFRNQQYRDEMIRDGFRGVYTYGKRDLLYGKNAPLRINSSGLPYGKKSSVNASIPSVQANAEKVVSEFVTKHFSDSPAMEGALICSEIRDHTNVSFDPFSKAAYKKFSGKDYPQLVREKDGVRYDTIKDFPISRVVPDDDPILTFYKWFWKDGDGWNPLFTRLSNTYKKAYKRPVWTFHDPAVRVPPIWGSGGNVDYVSHWTYANPNPINIGANTNELHAMAKGNKNQQVMNMTQIIMYRSATAPLGRRSDEPAWVKKYPNARYITLPPDMMRIAIWTQISRHVQGIMFHGLNSLIPWPKYRKDKSNIGYILTNEQTSAALSDIVLNVVKPLGPALKKVPERKFEVAILESFTSSMFANANTWGWTGWPFQLHLGLLWANMGPGVVYEETILRDGLEGVKVLVMPGCEVLSESVYKAILDFQKKGGIIVGDPSLVPGITPDIQVGPYVRNKDNGIDKKNLQKIGLQIRKELEPYHTPYVGTSDPDIVTWVRSSGNADYLFMVNDKRTFGDYLGVYKLLAEKTVPFKGTVTVRRKVGAVYDLRYHKEVPFTVSGSKTILKEAFTQKDIGKVYLLLPEKIKAVTLSIPAKVRKGDSFILKSALSFVSGRKVNTVHPIQITVKDPSGILTGDTTSAAQEKGSYSQKITIPLNAKSGKWSITAQDLASGKSLTKTVTVY